MAGVGAIRGHGGLLEGPVRIWRAPMATLVGGVCILRRGRDQELPEQRGAEALWIL
jgi:hypothetical protein